MGDMGDVFKEWRVLKKKRRAELGIPCQKCIELLPKAHPKILLPGQVCRMHGWRAPERRVRGETP